jgi:hypothetical protein
MVGMVAVGVLLIAVIVAVLDWHGQDAPHGPCHNLLIGCITTWQLHKITIW